MTPVVPHFEFSEEHPNERTSILNVRGEIHVSTAPEFARRLTDTIDAGKTGVVLDLTAVEFIDSTGLSVLLGALRELSRRQGRLAIVCANPTVLRLFEITRLDATFDIFGDREGALAHVQAGGSSAGAP